MSSSVAANCGDGAKIDGDCLEYICKNIDEVLGKIQAAVKARPEDVKLRSPDDVHLVAVSKTKPSTHILKAYQHGQRRFGENYIQELVAKAAELENECPDIKWHFIGHLQSNKVSKLMSAGKNLAVIETVDSLKIAAAINSQRVKWIEADSEGRKELPPLDVMIQVNTSGEQAKGGISPKGVEELVQFIQTECPRLNFRGLMTIGRDYVDLSDPNPDFIALRQVRDVICKRFYMLPREIELSMGMSADFEHAISAGSSNVRIGSTIFGQRNYAKQ